MNWKERLEKGYALFDVDLFHIGNTPVTAARLITLILVVLLTLWFSRLVQRGVLRAFARRGQADEGSVAVAARLARYLVLLLGLGIAIQNIGIDLTALFAAGAVFAVAVGFAMQNIAQNFVSGVILLAERTIKPGDVLEVDGQMVRVVDMGIRATVARTLDEEDILIPNSELVVNQVKNYTLTDTLYRLRAMVGVVYSADMALVKKVLEETAHDVPWRAKKKPPRILLSDFGDSAVNWEVSVWMDDPWQVRSRKSELNDAIWWALKEAGIVIAFPQVDVHFDPPVVESLAGLRKAG